ncbi:hypothetical protein [Paucibacter soli]|uniref:hypothetical protein n=1 Tax=Paucibacter soli TaxID=3133433 RepID=UPI00309A0C53
MRRTLILLVVALCVLLGLGLAYPEQARVRLRQVLASGQALVPGRGVEALHKCRVGATVEYRSAPCPAGSQEAAMTRGTVTVIAAPAAAPKPAAAAASLPTVRDLLAPPGEVDLQQRRIDQLTR